MKPVFDYKKVTVEQMVEYIKTYHPEDKAWFKSVSLDTVPAKTKRQYQTDDKGEVIYKPNKKGKMIPAVKVVAIGSETKVQFSMLKAKKAFFEKYMPEAMPKKKEEKASAVDELMTW